MLGSIGSLHFDFEKISQTDCVDIRMSKVGKKSIARRTLTDVVDNIL